MSLKQKKPAWADRFWSKVLRQAPDVCWPWIGALNSWGYGYFNIDGVLYRAHRVAFVLSKGEIPDGALILHSCDNRKCCNPAHLWKGSQSDNVKQEWERYRKPARALGLLVVRTRKNGHA